MLAQWVTQIVDLAVRKSGGDLMTVAPRFGGELAIYGMIALGQGALLVSMIWAAALVWIIERSFLKASAWMLVAAGIVVLWRNPRVPTERARNRESPRLVGRAGIHAELSRGGVISTGLPRVCAKQADRIRGLAFIIVGDCIWP